MIATMIRLHTEHLGGQDSGEGWPSDPHVQAASDFIWHPSVTHLLDSLHIHLGCSTAWHCTPYHPLTWDAGLQGTALEAVVIIYDRGTSRTIGRVLEGGQDLRRKAEETHQE